MPNFMLLLHQDPSGWYKLSPEEMQAAMEKYMAWNQKPYARGSNRLTTDSSRVIRGEGGKPRVMDGPYSETKEVLGGYYVIEAADYDEAVARSMDHPHLSFGGTIEIRQLWNT